MSEFEADYNGVEVSGLGSEVVYRSPNFWRDDWPEDEVLRERGLKQYTERLVESLDDLTPDQLGRIINGPEDYTGKVEEVGLKEINEQAFEDVLETLEDEGKVESFNRPKSPTNAIYDWQGFDSRYPAPHGVEDPYLVVEHTVRYKEDGISPDYFETAHDIPLHISIDILEELREEGKVQRKKKDEIDM